MSLDAYVDELWSLAVEAGPSSRPYDARAESEWQDLIAAGQLDEVEEASDAISSGLAFKFPRSSRASLLDDLPPHLRPSIAGPAGRNSSTSPTPAAENGLGDLPLLDRLKVHLPVSSTFNSLIVLLNTDRNNEDIQSELVEILGFEGDGLSLVEDLLKPGARGRVVQESGLAGGKSENVNRTVDEQSKAKENGIKRHYLPSARLTVTASRGTEKKTKIDLAEMIGSSDDIARRLQEQLDRPNSMFHEDGPRIVEQEVLPHVYSSAANATTHMSMGGRFALPAGHTRDIHDEYEEVIIPPSVQVPARMSERPVKISSLPRLARGCFKYPTLNRMQSIVYPTAMNTNENMLVCAPTGAGKTDVAIMSIIRVLEQYSTEGNTTHPSGFEINRDGFKIIYVAPMKALASEITRKFSARLRWLGIKVRELTGDMQMTRQEIAETQIIITTPEKWDVVTRKPSGEGELASKVRLLIIDEVHLLNEDRGAVIETIVARTLRQVESSQSLIRIVGLSATLPNYIDVSDFLRVNRYTGLFFFDGGFRPVPLEQHFLGIVGKPRSQQAARNMDRVVFDKVSALVEQGHQVMIFVHARKETVKTAQKMKEMALEEVMTSFFDPRDHPKYGLYRKEISTSRNKEMKELFDSGFGIHHAGMLREDRNKMEKMFEDQAIKVLCCTSTLAWGVNLPAHAVVIKGTQVYDSNKGAFMDLSVLDVLQIFGRAGRPGYETSGEGYICTTHDKLDHYLEAIMAQKPIESQFQRGMVDSLNAEIALGTIANVPEAIQWLGYTYLFVRMRKEPFLYGMPHDEPRDDPQLGNKRNQLITEAARTLDGARMIRFNEVKNEFAISDLGRIAAKFYLKYQTMEIFHQKLTVHMKNADLFEMLCEATEFEQIQIRENEIEELTAILQSEHCPLAVPGGGTVTTKQAKVNILLQAHISKVYLEDFALVSDAAYVAQNAARIIRALVEMALSKRWASVSGLLIDLSKSIERRQWPFIHPLFQITSLQKDTLHNLRRWADEVEIFELKDTDAKAVGELIHMNEHHGAALRNAALNFPMVSVEHSLRPLAHDLLSIQIKVTPSFTWNTRLSGGAEPFYIWIEDEEGKEIIQWRYLPLRPSTTSVDLTFDIPWTDRLGAISIVSASDKWLGSDETRMVSLHDLTMPDVPPEHSALSDIPFLHISGLQDQELEGAYKANIKTLNGIQTQAFWTIYHTQANVLLSAPVASGKSFMGDMAIWRAFKVDPAARVLVVLPSTFGVDETVARLRSVAPPSRKLSISPLLGNRHSGFLSATGQIGVTTPAALLRLGLEFLREAAAKVSLIVLDDLHLLDATYELAIASLLSVARTARTRLIGLASSLIDPTDLSHWLSVDPAQVFSFASSDRPSSISTSYRPFTIPHNATLLHAMIKPTYDILKSASAGAIVIAPSRAACRNIAKDLVTQSGTEMDLNGFLGVSRDDVEPMLYRLRDQSLYEPILRGIGYILPNMFPADLALVLELFASRILRALIIPREICWTLPVRAETVVLMSAQYVRILASRRAGDERGDRQIVNYSREELVKVQSLAVVSAAPTAPPGSFWVMCQAEQRESISRTLQNGLPLESGLPHILRRGSGGGIAATALRGMIPKRPVPRFEAHRPTQVDLRKRDMMDLVGYTYFAERMGSNPTYYDLHEEEMNEGVSRLVDKWFEGEDLAGAEAGASVAASALARGEKAKERVNGGGKDEPEVDGMEVGEEVPGPAGVGDEDGETLDEDKKPNGSI